MFKLIQISYILISSQLFGLNYSHNPYRKTNTTIYNYKKELDIICDRNIPSSNRIRTANWLLRRVGIEYMNPADHFKILITLARIPAVGDEQRIQHARAALGIVQAHAPGSPAEFDALITLARIPHNEDLQHAQAALRIAQAHALGYQAEFDALITLARIPHFRNIQHGEAALRIAQAYALGPQAEFDAQIALARIPDTYLEQNNRPMTQLDRARAAYYFFQSNRHLGYQAEFEALITLARIPHLGNIHHAQAALRIAQQLRDWRIIQQAQRALDNIQNSRQRNIRGMGAAAAAASGY